MITAARLSLIRLPTGALSKVPRSLVSTRNNSSELYSRKEKVEEDKFIREREKALLQHKHEKELAELEAKIAAEDRAGNLNAEAEYDAKLTLRVDELKKLLGGTGDKISAEGLLNIAKWKLDG